MGREREKVVVAMSGGVDSSVAAGLLARQGYEVHGITLDFSPCRDDGSEVSRCCGAGAADLARAAAERIGASHEVVECDDLFEAAVLRPAWREYSRGRTPSPCIACNRSVKFELLIRRARRLGATRIATGHYARLDRPAGGSPRLLRGRDPRKDQSYFLFSLTPEQLSVALFPLGELDKRRVRDLAREIGFMSADRPESQDACFAAAGGFAEGLRIKFGDEARPGPIVDLEGGALGRHEGVHHFTIGQRKGTGVSLGRPAYVVEIDGERDRVVLSTREDRLMARGLRAEGVVWAGGIAPESPRPCQAQVRYRHRAAAAIVTPEANGFAALRFDEPQRAITPGQAVVFYDDDLVLGGGRIERALGGDEADDEF